MRGLPFAMTHGRLLAEYVRDAGKDRRRTSLCGSCGGRMRVEPDRTTQQVRCPVCTRWQQVTVEEETPWHLTPAAAEALRRTKSWLRRL